MVSTNQSLVKTDDALLPAVRRSKKTREGRARSRQKKRPFKVTDTSFPPFKTWHGVLIFIAIPVGMLLLAKLLGTHVPRPMLYGVASVMGFYLVLRSFYSVELVLAVAIIYLPFSKTFVIPIAPGLNGTNVFLVLVLLAGFFQAQRNRTSLVQMLPGSKVVFGFAALSAFSAVTLTLRPGGFDYFLDDIWAIYKAWLDQFILYFVALSVIRDRDVAKRVVLYVAIGSMLVALYSVQEMFEKMGVSNIDKARVGGPHMQPNNFGGFVAYTMIPIIALFVVYINRIKAWLITPYLLLALKLLITSFSRGAYLAMALSGLLTGYLRGKSFVFFWLSLGLVVMLMFPSLIPESIVARMSSTEKAVSTTDQQLDKSSQTRLIMWEAAIEMTGENPIFGKGFKAFPLLKSQYTDSNVVESDPHSMYFYISSQMGIPALVFFLLMLMNLFEMGRKLSRKTDDKFVRAVGIGGAGVAASMAIINIFGSRFVNIDFTCYFMVFYVVVQFFFKEMLDKESEEKKNRKKRRRFPKPVYQEPEVT
ncbi:MAG: O-antigen ligase family protein [Gammaproteobacteria bacterium]|nr:O-antigen ligase family protein [Gammaproteobacteria bacterium]